jgi:hypothetical protein
LKRREKLPRFEKKLTTPEKTLQKQYKEKAIFCQGNTEIVASDDIKHIIYFRKRSGFMVV